MRLFSAIGLIGLSVAGTYAAIHPREVIGFYRQAYPSDPARQQALDMCIRRDRMFNRADAAAREACYREELAGTAYAPASVAPAPTAGPNFVDLYQAAGRGHLPADDIRVREQNQRYAQPAAAVPGQ